MQAVTIGIDPDSKAHGVAVYHQKKLVALKNMDLFELMQLIKTYQLPGYEVTLSIEDVCANKFVYARNEHKNKSAQSNIAIKTGRCQQAQAEIMRIADHLGIRYKLFRPGGGNWAKNKTLFERVTGWQNKSNEDTRSAAFFGYLCINR